MSFWHGTSGSIIGTNGIHVGTYEAATQALEASIGTPLTGTWDGTREYGKTMLAGQKTLKERGHWPTGYSCRAVQEDHLPDGTAKYRDRTPIPMDSFPIIIPVCIVGPMTNTPSQPHDDFKANGYMSAALKRGHAKRGYYYRNVGENCGSISAVVPTFAHLQIIDKSNT